MFWKVAGLKYFFTGYESKGTPDFYIRVTDEDIRREDIISSDFRFEEADECFINYILENYARYNGYELEVMCINELPWKEARSGCSRFEECHNVIDEGLMKKYHRKRYEDINE